ncbi:MAG: hypothetical protein HKM24_02210, partial [Gammaproteobacteria bacterium]|nr:hypothetical protein [Gammaproteobacteria bacterium]
HLDGAAEPMELMLAGVLHTHLRDASAPAQQARRARLRDPKTQRALSVVLGYLAQCGHQQQAEARAALRLGLNTIIGDSLNENLISLPDDQAVLADHWLQALAHLDGLTFDNKRKLLSAMVATVRHDGKITALEGELLRCIAACVHVPLAPFVKPQTVAQAAADNRSAA